MHTKDTQVFVKTSNWLPALALIGNKGLEITNCIFFYRSLHVSGLMGAPKIDSCLANSLKMVEFGESAFGRHFQFLKCAVNYIYSFIYNKKLVF